jgi:iron complex outermembrane recepter protein
LGYVNDFGTAGDLRRDETGRVDSRDLYSVLQWQPVERWQLVGGARLSWLDFEVDDHFIVPPDGDQPGNPDDSGSRRYRESSGAFAANYHLNDGWSAGLSAGWGFETPTLTEMAYRSEGTGLNTELEPARNRQQQLSLRSRDDGSVVISLFRIASRNELVVDQSVGGRTTFRNAAETQRRGVELSGGLLLSENWTARYSTTWLDATYSAGEFSGNQLPGIAKLQVYGQLDWQPWGDPRLTLAVSAWHRDEVATARRTLVVLRREDAVEVELPRERLGHAPRQGVVVTEPLDMTRRLRALLPSSARRPISCTSGSVTSTCSVDARPRKSCRGSKSWCRPC